MTINTVVLFGAGASYGSNDVLPYAPPLGADLYPMLKKNFPLTWGNLPHEIGIKFQNNFEEGMKVIWDEHLMSIDMGLLMQDMACYFAQFGQNNSNQNLYNRFIDKIKPHANNISLSSLNYDILLESAISVNELGINYSEKPIQNSIFVWKIHGSCNFIPSGITARRGIHYTSLASFNPTIIAVSPEQVVQFCRSDTALYPAMCVYMESKPIQIGYDTIKATQEIWASSISKANRVLIIGVRPNLNDTHIWNPIMETNAMVGYIGSNSDFIKYVENRRNGKTTKFIGHRWNEAFDDSITFVRERSRGS